MSLRDAVVLQNPYHPYATRFIDWFRAQGVDVVALYTDRREHDHLAWQFPLGPDRVAASYLGNEADLAAFAAAVSERWRVVAVVPFWEGAVVTAGRLAEVLGLDWAQPEVLARFRDKHALKAYVAARDPALRLNRTRLVASVADVRDALSRDGYDRFVLKPNDGYGNSRVGFFDRSTPDPELAAHLAAAGGRVVLMEEFVAGQEYYVNGQVDARGEVTVVHVGRYLRGCVNGKENVELGNHSVPRRDPSFGLAADYARAVVVATGLRRSPFHLELKIDDQGPCLIEVAARLVGGGVAFDDQWLHAGRFDPFAVAGHYYWRADPLPSLGLDWAHYDAGIFGQVAGTATTQGRIQRVAGVAEVEAMPEFHRWVLRPAVGDRLEPTVDLGHVPWSVALAAPDVPSWVRAAEHVRETLRWNEDVARASALDRARAYLPVVRRELSARRYAARARTRLQRV